MRYELRIVEGRREIESAPAIRVDTYRWLSGYEPAVTARAVLLENKGFLIRMICLENQPKTVYTGPDTPVCRDSCMECFINFAPETDDRYINLEANSAGTLHCKLGSGREDRVSLRSMGIPMPEVKAERSQGRWQLDYFIPLSCVEAIYGPRDFSEGQIIKANFYKCGDETDMPHFGMWSPVDTPTPDFHRPEFFGELVLVSG